jgi:AraC-like DNA-binding protein
MICHTEGIQPIAPAKWCGYDGVMSVFWDAEGQAGANAYYLSPDPRLVIFFNDVSHRISMANCLDGIGRCDRPMLRAIYVPAGVPLWTKFSGWHRFAHLDLHLHQDRLLRLLSPSVGGSAARTILRRPVEAQDLGPVETLASLLVDEVSNPSRHAVYAESLVAGIVTALLDIPDVPGKQLGARLTRAQMNKVMAAVKANGDRRMTVAEMADAVGLSESWFATAFKQTTGKTPLQWQLGRRIEQAQTLLTETCLSLADVAAQLGFSDQAHLTKVFRQIVGETPAAWRRSRLVLQDA